MLLVDWDGAPETPFRNTLENYLEYITQSGTHLIWQRQLIPFHSKAGRSRRVQCAVSIYMIKIHNRQNTCTEWYWQWGRQHACSGLKKIILSDHWKHLPLFIFCIMVCNCSYDWSRRTRRSWSIFSLHSLWLQSKFSTNKLLRREPRMLVW